MMYRGNVIGVFGDRQWTKQWVDDFIGEYGDCIKDIRRTKTNDTVYLKERTVIRTYTPNDNCRGVIVDQAYVSPDVDFDTINEIIKPLITVRRFPIQEWF